MSPPGGCHPGSQRGEQISVSLAGFREGGVFGREGPQEGVASGGRAGGGVSGGRARGPDPQGDLKNCPGPATASGAQAAESEPDTAWRGGEAAGAGGSGRPGNAGWGTRLTVSALPHTCCGPGRAPPARSEVPGGAEGRAGAVASARALRGAESGSGRVRRSAAAAVVGTPGARGSVQGVRSMVVASGLVPPSCSPRQVFPGETQPHLV